LTLFPHNPHIGHILLDLEKPEQIRYVGAALPDSLSASEFFHETGHIFNNHGGFKVLVRCILEDPEIDKLLLKLAASKKRWEKERDYHMDRIHWNLMFDNMNDDFHAHHVPRLYAAICDERSDYWLPERDQVITVTVVEKKRVNWLVTLSHVKERNLYFRASSLGEHITEGDTIRICISKSWYYQRRLFVSGEIEQ
jgi:hypothetical protein